MAKSFKEYIGTGGFAMGNVDNARPMVSLGKTDKPPKRNGRTADARGMGLTANYDSQAPGTMRPAASTNLKKLKEEELNELELKDIKNAAQRFAKGIYDKLKRIVTTKQRYEYAAKTLQDVIDRKKKERAKEGLPLRHDIGYYAAAVGNTFKDIDPKKLQTMVHEQNIKETPLYNYMLDKGVIKE